MSARIFSQEGFPALGTTSSGVCWSIGRAGGWDSFLAASKRVVGAVQIPVSLDIEAGFGDSAAVVTEHVRQVIELGACGINLEDGCVDGRLGDPTRLVEKICSIRDLCRDQAYPLFLNARTDVFLSGSADLAESIRRGQLYAEAGADMVFVPGLSDAAAIGTFVAEVPAPVNIYAGPTVPPVSQLSELGVRRLSVGCGPQQSALADTRRVARVLCTSGTYSAFTDEWLPFGDLELLCAE